MFTNLPDALSVFIERNKDMCFHKRAWHVINSHFSPILLYTSFINNLPRSITNRITQYQWSGHIVVHLIFEISNPLQLSHHFYPIICDTVWNVFWSWFLWWTCKKKKKEKYWNLLILHIHPYILHISMTDMYFVSIWWYIEAHWKWKLVKYFSPPSPHHSSSTIILIPEDSQCAILSHSFILPCALLLEGHSRVKMLMYFSPKDILLPWLNNNRAGWIWQVSQWNHCEKKSFSHSDQLTVQRKKNQQVGFGRKFNFPRDMWHLELSVCSQDILIDGNIWRHVKGYKWRQPEWAMWKI